jgi:plasmid stability protein
MFDASWYRYLPGTGRSQRPEECWIDLRTIAYNPINADTGGTVASITIRNLDDALKSRLRIQAAVHGRSMEDEARDILRSSLNREPPGPKQLGTAINELFKPFGGFDLPEMPREPVREPPTFDE